MKQVIPIEIEDQNNILEEEMSKLLYHIEFLINNETVEELMKSHMPTWTAITFVHNNIKTLVDDLNE